MWTPELDSEYEKRVKRWPKKYHRELSAVLDNFHTLVSSLDYGAKVEQVRAMGFVHVEPRGILAIDQKGGGSGLRQTRLYTYPEQSSHIIYVITIGDKSTQSADIKYSVEFVDSLFNTRQTELDQNDSEKTV